MRGAADGGCSSAWLEPQIVDLVVAGSNPVSHPILLRIQLPRPFSWFRVRSSEFNVPSYWWASVLTNLAQPGTRNTKLGAFTSGEGRRDGEGRHQIPLPKTWLAP